MYRTDCSHTLSSFRPKLYSLNLKNPKIIRVVQLSSNPQSRDTSCQQTSAPRQSVQDHDAVVNQAGKVTPSRQWWRRRAGGERLLSARPRAPSSAETRQSCYRRPFTRQQLVQALRTSPAFRYCCNDVVLMVTHRFCLIDLYLQIELRSAIVNVTEIGS